jgi:hypothetical protein
MAGDPFEPRPPIVVYMGSVHLVGRRLSMGSYGSKYIKALSWNCVKVTQASLVRTDSLVL